MNIIDIKINDLVPYENNPRFNEKAVEKVKASIKEFGFKVPVVVDKNNVIVAGHTRVKAAEQLGIEVVPCLVADDLTDEQIKAFRLVDNKVSEFAEWDFSKLEEEMAELGDFDLSEFGFAEIEREQDFIGDLLDNGLGVDEQVKESDIFGITFNFPIEKRAEIEAWVKKKTKDYVVAMIMDEVAKDGN